MVRKFATEPQTIDLLVTNCVSAATKGKDAYAASPNELNKLDKTFCKYLRALSMGKAHESTDMESHGRSWTNAQLLHKWKVPPARAEIAIRRIKWWQTL